jgi:type VI secretion system FHA domain protein
MILTLEVLGEQATALGAGSRKVFHSIGGTIGRLPDNDWVFPDPYVSGRHALIRYLNGKFFIEDTSTNGVFINSPGHRLSKTQAHPLRSGDVLYIDAYQIRVAIEKEAGGSKAADDPFAGLPERGRKAAAPPARPVPPVPAAHEEDHTASLVVASEEQEIEWFGLSEAGLPPQSAAPSRAESPRAPAPQPRRSPPPPTRPTPMHGSAGRAEFKPESSGSHAAHSPGSGGNDAYLRELMAAAGIEGLEPSAELAHTFGDILRVMVGGLMEVLRARERMKDELRMRGTTFQPAHNNPLKFSANVDDAFHNLLVKRNPAYLAPTDAFEDALHDIRDHQTAILTATRLAFETMLAQFDPERLQDEFERQNKKGSILGVPAKMRYWDLYRDKYGVLAKDADASFRKLFGEEFAKAYEEQLARLKVLNRT